MSCNREPSTAGRLGKAYLEDPAEYRLVQTRVKRAIAMRLPSSAALTMPPA
jgi:hypothetical protein